MCREKKQHITHQLICKLWPHKQNDDEIYLSRILSLRSHSFLFQNVQVCIWGENAYPISIRWSFIRIYLIIAHFWKPLFSWKMMYSWLGHLTLLWLRYLWMLRGYVSKCKNTLWMFSEIVFTIQYLFKHIIFPFTFLNIIPSGSRN